MLNSGRCEAVPPGTPATHSWRSTSRTLDKLENLSGHNVETCCFWRRHVKRRGHVLRRDHAVATQRCTIEAYGVSQMLKPKSSLLHLNCTR